LNLPNLPVRSTIKVSLAAPRYARAPRAGRLNTNR
jgi:hypothetical protein